MATIRERRKSDGTLIAIHVQARMSGFPTRTESFPTRRLAERWAKTIEAEMIEGRHFRMVEARRRSMAAAIDRYIEEELPKKRDGNMHRACLPWWKARIGEMKLAEVTPAVIVEWQVARETYTRADSAAKRTILKEGEKPKLYTRSPAEAVRKDRRRSCSLSVVESARYKLR